MNVQEQHDVRTMLDTLCRSVKPSDRFYQQCLDNSLIDKHALKIIKECGCSDGHQITMLLHCMTPLGAVGFQKLLKVLEDNNSVDSNFMEKLKGSNDLIEAWEKHHKFIIVSILTTQNKEITTKIAEDIKTKHSHLEDEIHNLRKENESMREVNKDQAKQIQDQSEINEKQGKKFKDMTKQLNVLSKKKQTLDAEHQTELTCEDLEQQVKKIEDLERKVQQLEEELMLAKNKLENYENCPPRSRKSIARGRSHSEPSTPLIRYAATTSSLPPLPSTIQSHYTSLVNRSYKEPKPLSKNLIMQHRHPTQINESLPVIQMEGSNNNIQVSTSTGRSIKRATITPANGGKLHTENLVFHFSPGAVRSQTDVLVEESNVFAEESKELEEADLSQYIRPGKRFRINSTPKMSVQGQGIAVATQMPTNQDGSCEQCSLVVHQKKRKLNNNHSKQVESHDITDTCKCITSQGQVSYHVPGFGDYQEYWIMKKQLHEKDETIDKQKQRINRLRQQLLDVKNLGGIICDFSAFLPRNMPIYSMHVVCCDQRIEPEWCKVLTGFLKRQETLRCGQASAARKLFHNDKLNFLDENNQLLLTTNFRLDITQIEGQEFKLPLKQSVIPQTIQIQKASVVGNKWFSVCEIATAPCGKMLNGKELGHRLILREHRVAIVETVDYFQVKDHFIQAAILNINLCEEIESLTTNKKRMGKLLDTLATQSTNVVDVFCKALHDSEIEVYQLLADKLCNQLAKSENNP